jgi:hypothetical protein
MTDPTPTTVLSKRTELAGDAKVAFGDRSVGAVLVGADMSPSMFDNKDMDKGQTRIEVQRVLLDAIASGDYLPKAAKAMSTLAVVGFSTSADKFLSAHIKRACPNHPGVVADKQLFDGDKDPLITLADRKTRACGECQTRVTDFICSVQQGTRAVRCVVANVVTEWTWTHSFRVFC